MINFDDVTKENIKEHNPNWSQIRDPQYRILIIGGSGSGKTNALFNLISQQPGIDKIYLYAKDPYEAKGQFLINKRESTDLKYLNDSKAFTEYLNNMDDISKNIEEKNPNEKRKTLTVFDDLIADMLINKKLNPIVTKLFTESYFSVLKNIRLNSKQCFIMEIPSKQELQQIAFNNSSDIDFKDFINLYKKCTTKLYSFLVNDTSLALGNPLRFRNNLFERIKN